METTGSVRLKATELAALVKLVGKFKVPVLLDTRREIPGNTIEQEPYLKVFVCPDAGAAFAIGYGKDALEIPLEHGLRLMCAARSTDHGMTEGGF